jgi:hypothetical protein
MLWLQRLLWVLPAIGALIRRIFPAQLSDSELIRDSITINHPLAGRGAADATVQVTRSGTRFLGRSQSGPQSFSSQSASPSGCQLSVAKNSTIRNVAAGDLRLLNRDEPMSAHPFLPMLVHLTVPFFLLNA